MRINRSAPLAPNPYDATGISQWIDENAQQQIFVSTVEVPGSRGVYKLFLSNGHGLGSSYAPGIPCLVTGAELSSILSLVQSTCSKRGIPIPPFFLFSKSGRREDREFAGFTPPQRSEWVFWRPHIDLLPRSYLRILPFFIETDKWARLIEAYRGTWSQINPTFGIPSDGDEFPLAVMFLFPRQKDWIPHLRLTTKSGAALYFPLLQWPSVESRLKYKDFPASAASVAHATLSVWETFDSL